MSRIVVLDYGSSNLRSVARALTAAAAGRHRITVSGRAGEILQADKVVFPGQGAMGQCMRHLGQRGLSRVIRECILTKPFLGICLGLQSLMEHSDEDGGVRGLGILPGRVMRFTDDARDERGNVCKIPSMGWNRVYRAGPHPLWQNIKDGSRFYFVHSYYIVPEKKSDIAAHTDYICRYASAAARGNLFATQFHPEKSQQDGLQLLKNFVDWDGRVEAAGPAQTAGF